MISRHFSLQDSYNDINMYEAHPVYPVYVIPSYFESDPSTATVPFIKTDSSETTPMDIIRLDSEALSIVRTKLRDVVVEVREMASSPLGLRELV